MQYLSVRMQSGGSGKISVLEWPEHHINLKLIVCLLTLWSLQSMFL